ncbi:uncharacterized protein LOC144721623 isoform X1 [Lampetra planeri]
MNRIANSTTHDTDSGIDDPGSAPSTCACCVRARVSPPPSSSPSPPHRHHHHHHRHGLRRPHSHRELRGPLPRPLLAGVRRREAPGRRLRGRAAASSPQGTDGGGGEVQAAFQPCSASASAQSTAAAAFPGVEPTAAQEAALSASLEVGALRLPAGDPCDSELRALWLPLPGDGGGGGAGPAAAPPAAAASVLALTLLCEEHDNMTLAESTLRHVRHALLERLLPPVAPAAALGCEALLQADRVDAVLAALLPFGQLLFLNHQFVQSVERELSAYVNVK